MGLVGSRATVEQLSEELADVVICVDLVAMDLDIDLRKSIIEKFNATSEKRGLTTRFPEVSERSASQALVDVTAERRRQIEVEGWTPEHDDTYTNGEIARAAACYAQHAGTDEDGRQINSGFSPEDLWPWGVSWKPSSRRRDLVKAGALILAEIERLDRIAPPSAATDRSE